MEKSRPITTSNILCAHIKSQMAFAAVASEVLSYVPTVLRYAPLLVETIAETKNLFNQSSTDTSGVLGGLVDLFTDQKNYGMNETVTGPVNPDNFFAPRAKQKREKRASKSSKRPRSDAGIDSYVKGLIREDLDNPVPPDVQAIRLIQQTPTVIEAYGPRSAPVQTENLEKKGIPATSEDKAQTDVKAPTSATEIKVAAANPNGFGGFAGGGAQEKIAVANPSGFGGFAGASGAQEKVAIADELAKGGHKAPVSTVLDKKQRPETYTINTTGLQDEIQLENSRDPNGKLLSGISSTFEQNYKYKKDFSMKGSYEELELDDPYANTRSNAGKAAFL